MGAVRENDRWPEWMRSGVRVVRGPDLAPTMRPNEVELGTLTYVPTKVGDNKVCVIWDSGRERYLQSGASGCYELRAYDIQQVGIVHAGIKCGSCDESPIRGMRFHCPRPKFDLCTTCYMTDSGRVDIAFIRLDTPSSDGVLLPTRSLTKHMKPKLKGIFETAKVVPGPHWNYVDNRDGSADNDGMVVAFPAVQDAASRGWVEVQWARSGQTGHYRLGAGGYVDVVATEMVVSDGVYIEHLPVVGIIKLKIGDKVCINLTLDEFKKLQCKVIDDSGWTDNMKEYLRQTGTVVQLSPDGTLASVQYMDGNWFWIAQDALYRLRSLYVGCAVLIINDKQAFKEIQQGQDDISGEVCGKLGRVLDARPDGDFVVLVGDKEHVLSPACCEPLEDAKTARNAPDMPKGYTQTIRKPIIPNRKPDMDSLAKEMLDAFNVGDISKVKSLIEKNKQLVRYKMDDRTLIHLASHEGPTDLLTFLIGLGGDIKETDSEGDTPLHYAALGQQADCVEALLKAGADPNIKNNDGNTPLTIAIDNPCVDTVQILVRNKAKVNIDCDGSTAMHDAVEQKEGQPLISAVVLGADFADFTVCNTAGFNVMQWAIMENNAKAVEMIIARNKKLVTVKKLPEGYSPLHMAAANDFIDIAGLLLEKGSADANARDRQQMTPLHLAAMQGHKRTIELLIDKKADVVAQDVDGNTPLHLAQLPPIQDMNISVLSKGSAESTNIKITYILLEKGADLNKKNKKGKTPLDLVDDDDTKKMIESMASKYQIDPMKSVKGVACPMHWAPVDFNETKLVRLDVKKPVEKREFDDVAANFRKTLPACKVHSIERVQSRILWEHYCLKKMQMEGRLGKGQANELHLFHGTKPNLVPIIVKDNFDFRLSGSNVGAQYGNGAYFARTAKYSNGFAQRDDSGYKHIFVVKVLAGKMCVGQKGMNVPPYIDPKKIEEGRYDSTVDRLINTEIYSIFDVNQYYPEFVVKYEA